MRECKEKIKNIEELEFAVFCIESIASRLGMDGRRIYDALTKRVIFLMNILCQNMGYYTPREKSILWMTFWFCIIRYNISR